MTTLVNAYAFPEADGALNGSLWSNPTGIFGVQVLSHQAINGTTGTIVESLYTGGGAVANDQWAQVRLVACGASGFLGAMLRGSTGGDTCYICFVDKIGASAGITVARRNAGAFTSLATSTITTAANDDLYFEIQGLTLKVNQNGSIISALTFTDSGGSTISSGYPGIVMGGSTTNAQKISLFSMGDFTGSGRLVGGTLSGGLLLGSLA